MNRLIVIIMFLNSINGQKNWHDFKIMYNKQYTNKSIEEYRENIFNDNIAMINNHNHNYDSYKLGINEFADLTQDEFFGNYIIDEMRYGHHLNFVECKQIDYSNIYLGIPKFKDWRLKNCVSSVKNQIYCGSSWAYSAVGAIEGIMAISTGRLLDLSVDQIVDCSILDYGCKGGLIKNAFNYASYNNGLCSDEDYTNEHLSNYQECVSAYCDIVPESKITGCVDIIGGGEDGLKFAVSQQPISVAIHLDKSVFQFYKSGIFDSYDCGDNLDHGVLVVGYTQDYWIVKNSWGTSWGEDGYIKIKMGNNICGISDIPTYPII